MATLLYTSIICFWMCFCCTKHHPPPPTRECLRTAVWNIICEAQCPEKARHNAETDLPKIANSAFRGATTIPVFLLQRSSTLLLQVCPPKSAFGTRLCACGRARNVPGPPQARLTFTAGSCTAMKDRHQLS